MTPGPACARPTIGHPPLRLPAVTVVAVPPREHRVAARRGHHPGAEERDHARNDRRRWMRSRRRTAQHRVAVGEQRKHGDSRADARHETAGIESHQEQARRGARDDDRHAREQRREDRSAERKQDDRPHRPCPRRPQGDGLELDHIPGTRLTAAHRCWSSAPRVRAGPPRGRFPYWEGGLADVTRTSGRSVRRVVLR